MKKQRPSVKRLRKQRVAAGKELSQRDKERGRTRVRIPFARRIYPGLMYVPERPIDWGVNEAAIIPHGLYADFLFNFGGTNTLKRLLKTWEVYLTDEPINFLRYYTSNLSRLLKSWENLYVCD